MQNVLISDAEGFIYVLIIFFLFCSMIMLGLGFYKINNYKKAMSLLIDRNHRSATNLKKEMLSIVHHLVVACYISLFCTVVGTVAVFFLYRLALLNQC